MAKKVVSNKGKKAVAKTTAAKAKPAAKKSATKKVMATSKTKSPSTASMTAREQVLFYQISTVEEMNRSSKETIVNKSEGFLEAILKTFFAAGFEVSEIDPVLAEEQLSNLPYGRFYIKLSHKNFSRLKGDKYVPEVFLSFSEDHDQVVISKFCLNFQKEGLTILMPANVKGNWTYRESTNKKAWYDIVQPAISNFLEKIPTLIRFIERTKAKVLNPKQANVIKLEIIRLFMAPQRINSRYMLWKETDRKAFLRKPVYENEANLFEAIVNVIAVFTANSISEEKEYLVYSYVDEKVYNDKNGKYAQEDIHTGKLAVPIPFNRRTYYIFSSVTEVVEQYIDQEVKVGVGFEV